MEITVSPENENSETIEALQDVIEDLTDTVETAVEELGDAVETISETTETISEEPPVPEHNHEHFHSDLEQRVAELEQKTDVLVQRQVEDIVEESQEPTIETETITEEIPIEELPEETIIEPPTDRSESSGPKGVFKFFKAIGW